MHDSKNLLELVKSFSAAVQISNKRWVVAASVSLLGIAFDPKAKIQTVFGTSFDATLFPFALVITISACFVAYANSHIQTTTKKDILDEVILKGDFDLCLPTTSYEPKDVVHAYVSESSFDQLYHFTSPFGNPEVRALVYKIAKTVLDALYVFFPVFSIEMIFRKSQIIGLNYWIATGAELVSFLAALVLYWIILQYIWSRKFGPRLTSPAASPAP